jgi:predicted acyl esterase
MVQLPSSGPAWQGPPPKHGHLSEIDPEFAKLKDEVDKTFDVLWSLPLDEFKAAWLSAPVAFPNNAPQPGQDYAVLEQEAPVRDGTKLGIRIYKPLKCESAATLVLKAHGGGQ